MIGAPKAGTTALFKAICRHPKIYMPRSKEPRYFSYPDIYPSFIGPGTEKNKRRIFHARQAYLQLFADCPLNFITGEASTQYLGDHSAAEEAFKHIPFCRLIAILRHPVDRAYS
ncbi:MAG: sulfotransferase, partial [Cyanobacteriota bacterium]|nr:sulfotransferase [Cyanobacteriota bacterium]